MIRYRCPHCGKPLETNENHKSFHCENRHCFDVAKQGYVNLLCNNKQGNHGDDKLMVEARNRFLNHGAYAPLCDRLTELIEKYCREQPVLLDAGSGEGYYTKGIEAALIKEGAELMDIFGVDISKEAIAKAAKGSKSIHWSVGSVYDLPFFESSFSAVTSIFSPLAKEEFHRVLKDGGFLFMVIPLENHLWELKCAVYDTPYRNQPVEDRLDGFELSERCELKYKFTLESTQLIKDLFFMTPYAYNTSPDNIKKLDKIHELTITAHFAVFVYRKRKKEK